MNKNTNKTNSEKDSSLSKAKRGKARRRPRSRDRHDGNLEERALSKPYDRAVKAEPRVGDTGSPEIRLFNEIVGVMEPSAHRDRAVAAINDALELFSSIAPRDSVEQMLAAQMVAAHSAAMRGLRVALSKEQPLQVLQLCTNLATKFMRTYTAQVEALGKYRNKAKQTVVVKHVHVNEGGQAIVGNVNRGEGGGGKE